MPGSTVFPGGSWQRRLEQDPEGTARYPEEFALRRFGRPEEIAAAAGKPILARLSAY